MNEYAHLELHDRAIRFKYQRASLLLFGHSSIWKDTCFGDHSSFYDHHASSAINYLSELATFHVFSFYVLCLLSHVKLHPSAKPPKGQLLARLQFVWRLWGPSIGSQAKICLLAHTGKERFGKIKKGKGARPTQKEEESNIIADEHFNKGANLHRVPANVRAEVEGCVPASVMTTFLIRRFRLSAKTDDKLFLIGVHLRATFQGFSLCFLSTVLSFSCGCVPLWWQHLW